MPLSTVGPIATGTASLSVPLDWMLAIDGLMIHDTGYRTEPIPVGPEATPIPVFEEDGGHAEEKAQKYTSLEANGLDS